MISIACRLSLQQAKPHLHLSRTSELSSGLTRLLSSLAVLEQKDGRLLAGSLGAVTAAQKLGGSITGFLAGSNIKSAAESAARVQGVEKVIAVDNVAYDKVSCPAPRFILHSLLMLFDIGPSGKLCATTGGKHSKRWLHPRFGGPFGLWQEFDAQGRCAT